MDDALEEVLEVQEDVEEQEVADVRENVEDANAQENNVGRTQMESLVTPLVGRWWIIRSECCWNLTWDPTMLDSYFDSYLVLGLLHRNLK